MQATYCFRPALEALESRFTPSLYLVAPYGNDSAAGTPDAPWLTLQHAADRVQPGDSVLVEPGAYQGFQLTTSGLPELPILFQAQPGVRIVARNPATPDGINLEGASYVAIDGFTVTGMPRAGIRAVQDEAVSILHNTCAANGWWGIFTGFSNRVVIDGNVASNSAIEHGIYVSNACVAPIVSNNVVFGNAKNGIHMNGDAGQGGTGVIQNALIEDNTIYANGRAGGSGINLDGVQHSLIQNNLLYGNHASGISLYRQDAAGPASGNVVVNNTVVMAADARWALNIQNGSTDNIVFNNIFFNLHRWHGAVNLSADSLPGFVSDHNAVTGRFTLDDEATLLDLAGWQAATGQDVDSFAATADALFAGAGDYHVLVGSAASQTGVAALAGYYAPTADHDGHNRPADAIDLGAFQNDAPVVPGTPDWRGIVVLPWKGEPIAILDGLA